MVKFKLGRRVALQLTKREVVDKIMSSHVTDPHHVLHPTTMSYYPQPGTSRSPPPLQHPIPTHPPTAPPEPPATPGSPSGYMRFTSSPQNPAASPGRQYAQYGGGGYAPPQPQPGYGQPQWQNFGAVPAGVGAVPVPGTQPGIPPQVAPGFAMPAAAAMWGVNDATAQMGVQLGRSAVAAGQDYMEKNVSSDRMCKCVGRGANLGSDLVWATPLAVVDPQTPIQRVEPIRAEQT